MAFRNLKISTVPDGASTARVQPSDLNKLVASASPVDGDEWLDISGTSPNRFLRYKVYDGGAWRILIELQY